MRKSYTSAAMPTVLPAVLGPPSDAGLVRAMGGVPKEKLVFLTKDGTADTIGLSIKRYVSPVFALPTTGTRYYVADSGTAEKAGAVSAESPMSLAVFNSATFSPGDIVVFSGEFDLTSTTVTIPTSGTNWDSPIYYISDDSDPAILNGNAKDVFTAGDLLDSDEKNYVVIYGFSFKNITNSGGAGGQALSVNNSIIKCYNLSFSDFTISTGGGCAWVEVGGTGAENYFYNCIFPWIEDEAVSNHTAGTGWTLEFYNCSFSNDTGSGDDYFQFMQLVNSPGSLIFNQCTFNNVESAVTTTPITASFNSCTMINCNNMPYASYRQCLFTVSIGSAGNRLFDKGAELLSCTLYGSGSTLVMLFNVATDPAYSFTAKNCIIENFWYVVRFYNTTGATATISSSCIYDTDAVLGETNNTYNASDNITNNPLLDDDYRLTGESPCLSVGTSPYVDGDGDQYDRDGYSVWDDGTNLPDGQWIDGVDVGAFSYGGTTFIHALEISEGVFAWPSAPVIIGITGVDNAVYNLDGTAKTFASFSLAFDAMASLADDIYIFAGNTEIAFYGADMSARAALINQRLK